jgi:sugar transferase EpsL
MNCLSKRFLDVAVSAVLLLLLAPLMGVLALWILASEGRPVLFRQRRPGLGEKPFVLLKFRTMTEARDARGHLLPDGTRLTPLGRRLRRTSLDELPQLWNVLAGHMSLVGPRPLLARYLSRYTPEQARRHRVKPGITGWAQVRGRNALSWEEKFALDLWYVDHRSFALDLRILGETLWHALRGDGINQPGQDTAEEFRGASSSPAITEAVAKRSHPCEGDTSCSR